MVWGQASEQLGYVFDTDEANLGKAGNFALNTIVQDAFLSYSFAPQLRVDAGLMLLPFSRHVLEAASSLNTIDYHAEAFRFPVSLGFRDVGVQLRGLLGTNHFHYRIGIFEGVRASAVPAAAAANGEAPPPRPALNSRNLPRVTGQLRFNLLGSERDFFFKGIYFSTTPLVSIGISGDFQQHAVYTDLATGARGSYRALNADVFAELPVDPGNEAITKASASYYGRGTSTIASGSALLEGGFSGYVEAGFRHGPVEPLAFLEYLRERSGALTLLAAHAGLNLWADKYTFNLKTDFGYRRAESNEKASQMTFLWSTQAQLLF